MRKKYELIRGKKSWLTKKKNIPLQMQSSIHKGIESSLLKKFLAEKNYATSALPIKKVAAKATIA